MDNKEKAKAYYTAVSNYDESTIKKMVDKNYIQHNPKVASGREAFLSMIPTLKQYGSTIQNIRMLEDDQHIIMHHQWLNATPFGYDTTAAFHIIRFDYNGLIAEHWNVMTEMTPVNISGRSLLNGETEIKDLNKTKINKSKITALFDILTSQSTEKIIAALPQFFQPDFHQHNAALGDGLQNLIQTIREKTLFPLYKKQHAVFGEGNFVLSISKGLFLEKNSALYDLFSLEQGKIVSHWSIYQDIPTKDVANTNTMFNFYKNITTLK